MGLMQGRRSGRNFLAAGAAVLAVSAGAVAWANDTIFPDAESDTAHGSPNLAYGGGARDCTTRGNAVNGTVTVDYNGGQTTDYTKHFKAGEALTVSFDPPTGSGIVVTPGVVPNVPGTWGSDQADNITIPFTTTVPANAADDTYSVDVTVVGQTSGYGAGAEEPGGGKPKFQIIVNCASTVPPNTAPTVSFTTAPTSVTEGDVAAYAFSVVDPDAGQTIDYAAGYPSCGALGSVDGTPTITNSGGSFSCLFPDGVNPADSSDVSVQVSDGVGLSSIVHTNTTVTNATPVVSALTLGGNTGTACLAGKTVTLDFGFSDAGLYDNPWHVGVTWGQGADSSYDASAQGPQTQLSHVYVGAGSWAVNAKVTDKDSDFGTSSSGAGAVSLLYSTGQGILQPINYTGPRSAFKVGSTIPVKIKITDCDGKPVSGLAPQLSLKFVDGSPDGLVLEDVVSTVPDQGTTMRYTGSPDYQYIYNLATKGRSVGDYDVTVSDPTIAPITARFSLKK